HQQDMCSASREADRERGRREGGDTGGPLPLHGVGWIPLGGGRGQDRLRRACRERALEAARPSGQPAPGKCRDRGLRQPGGAAMTRLPAYDGSPLAQPWISWRGLPADAFGPAGIAAMTAALGGMSFTPDDGWR